MSNADFWKSIDGIIADGFTPEGLQKFDHYAELFINGRLVYKRFSPFEQHGCATGGTTHVVASLLAGAETAPDRDAAPDGNDFKRELQRGAQQADRIERWARTVGCWTERIDDSLPKMLGDQIAEGGEAVVHDHGATLVKAIGLDYFIQPILALDRISLHNAYFPETTLTVLGFGRTAVDDKHYSYYVYDHSGERRVKLTGESELLDANADLMLTGSLLYKPTLYPSPYLVLSNKEYTKHYYAGADRVAACLGGGGLDLSLQKSDCHLTEPSASSISSSYFDPVYPGEETGDDDGLPDCETLMSSMQKTANELFGQSRKQLDNRELERNDPDCLWKPENFWETEEYFRKELQRPIEGIPERLYVKEVYVKLDEFRENTEKLKKIHHDESDYIYYYHGDHLGSASWITDHHGLPVQHLQYLPYGEPYVDQRTSGYSERFRFTGKERDEETGYGYFGARYMDHELMTGWLSVDPMADKYPHISPYNYCMWNPVRVTDPNGMDTIVFDGDGNFSNRIKADGNHVGRLLDKNGNKRFDFEFVCQQDADRCCSPGSPEEVEIKVQDKLPHAKDCPAEETAPIHRIELVWQKDIISMLKESGAGNKKFLPYIARIGYALFASDGGSLDFDYTYRTENEVWKDNTLYIPMVPGERYAHNASNLGNFLWGAAMFQMGITPWDVLAGSNLHALFKHHEFDSLDDQLSIGLGYSYSFRLNQSR